MIPELNFIDAFVAIFNINASLLIIIFCAHVLLRTTRLDRGLFRARLFLNGAILQQIWMSISIAGAAFALNALLTFVGIYLAIRNIIYDYYLIEISQMIFLLSFVYAVISWYQFISFPDQNDQLSSE